MKKVIISILILITFFLTGCENLTRGSFHLDELFDPASKIEPADLNIACASSLKQPMDELTYIFEDEYPQLTLNFYYASSSECVAEIEAGQKTDFFISSSMYQMDILQSKGKLVDGTRQNLVLNTLVLVANVDSELTSLTDLTTYDVDDITIGDPDEVPSGKYAIEALENLGIYDDIRKKISYADNTAEMIEDLEDKDTDVAIMYRSDVTGNSDLRILETISTDYYNPVVYQMAEITGTEYSTQVKAFEDFLLSDRALALLESYGYTRIVVPETPENE